MNATTLRERLAEAEATIRTLQEELAQTNRGLLALNMEMDERVEERTAELAKANEALRAEIAERQRVEAERVRLVESLERSAQAAEAANVAKSQFLANMSHELRTPMNAILGMTDLALGEDLPATTRDYLETAKQSADSLLELLNEILDLSRIEAGSFQLESAPFDLRETVQQVVKTLGVRAYEKGLELVCDLGNVPCALVGDPLRLRQVLVNLVGNAIKFTAKGEVVVRVREEGRGEKGEGREEKREGRRERGEGRRADGELGLTTKDEISSPLPSPLFPLPSSSFPLPSSSVLLEFAVSDTGIGIPPEAQERIFAPFSQADASTTRDYGGTGLGLTISQRLVNLMGGRIWVESDLGSGSTFRFTARLGVQEEFEEEPALPAISREALRGLPVLIVAENPTSSRILAETFARWSMKPETAPDVPTALAKVHKAASARQNFRLILVDALMPGIDGFTLAEWLQNDARLAGPIVLMLSAADRARQPKRCQAVGALCLEKPISQSNLFKLIAEALGIQQQAAQAADSTAATISATPSRLLRVLLAEDTPANQKLVTYILGKRGHCVEVVQNGKQALEALGQMDFDVVLMDVQMPVMDGFQATRAVRKLTDCTKARVPVIAMTAHALKGDADRCLEAGMDGYLSKPVKGEELIGLVERMAEGRSGALDRGAASQTQPAASDREPRAAAQPLIPVFDLDDAVSKCFGDYTIFQEMAGCLFDEADSSLKRMRTALTSGDAAEIAHAAHRLKGTLVYLSAAPAVAATRHVEEIGRSGQLVGTAEAIQQLAEQLGLLQQAIAPHRPKAAN